MTANVAQVFVEDAEWNATLRAAFAVLHPGGCLVFETRDPAKRAWESWTPESTRGSAPIDEFGLVEEWMEVTAVTEPTTVTFDSHLEVGGRSRTSTSQLRFRPEDELRDSVTRPGSPCGRSGTHPTAPAASSSSSPSARTLGRVGECPVLTGSAQPLSGDHGAHPCPQGPPRVGPIVHAERLRGHPMSTQHEVITAEMPLRLVVPNGPSLPLIADLSYDVADPYAVRIGFRTGSADEPSDADDWTFARQLLSDGIAQAVGDGDVQVWPLSSEHGPLVCLALSSPTGKAVFEMTLAEVVEFLSATYAAVPTGSESDFVDIDAELALLLWADGSGPA